MNSENLKTASLYINNQLLCRGLLRHGRSIDFALLESLDDTADTAARIMGVVNNLILLRDRDADQLENASETIRALRTDVTKLSTELERSRGEKSDISRRLVAIEAEKKSAEGRLRASESKERVLRVKVERMKSEVSQVRTMCAVDCRKREKIIDGLKKTVSESGHVRGGKNLKSREIFITGDIGEDHCTIMPISLDTKDYNPRSETNEFLTQFARELSEENENLNRLAQWTLDTMKEISAWDPTQNNNNQSTVQIDPMDLSAETEAVIEHIRTLLTSPSFVSLEELEVREEEIFQLRKGWEHMEKRWIELVGMIDGWRKRMLRGGETVNLEELKMGLRLGPKLPHCGDSKARKLSVLQEYSSEDEDPCQGLVNKPENSDKFECNVRLESDDDVYDDDNDDDDDNDNDDVMSTDSSLYQESSTDEYIKEDEKKEASIQDTQGVKLNTTSSMNPCPITRNSPVFETKIPITPEKYSSLQEQKLCSPISEEDTIDLLQLGSSPISGANAESDGRSACSYQKTPTPVDSKSAGLYQKTPKSPDDKSAYSYPNTSIPSEEDIEIQPKMSVQSQTVDSAKSLSRSSPNDFSRDFPLAQPSRSSQNTQAITPLSQSKQQTRAPNSNSQPNQVDQHFRKKSISPSKSQAERENASLPISRVVKSTATPKLKLGSDCRLPRPRSLASQQSPLTLANIAAKLAASEREANAARVRAKLRAARSEKNTINSVDRNRTPSSRKQNKKSQQTPIKNTSQTSSKTCDDYNQTNGDEYQLETNNKNENGSFGSLDIPDSVGRLQNNSSRKRKARDIVQKVTGKNRRRSTLSPWELEKVIRGDATSEEKDIRDNEC